jgi:hypothetical protein
VIGALAQPVVSAYRLAIDQTTGAIDRRAKYFRNLIAVVALVSLGSVFWAVGTGTFSPLVALLLLLPACTLFFFFDAILLNDWRSKLFESWTKRQLDFQAFRQAVGAIPTLPKNTLDGMLATLPTVSHIVAEQAISSGTRGAIAIAVTTIHGSAADAVAARAVGYAIASCSLIAAMILQRSQPLFGIVAIVSMPLAVHFLRRLRLRSAVKKTLVAQRQSDFDVEKYLTVVDSLIWDPISISSKARFLEKVRSTK